MSRPFSVFGLLCSLFFISLPALSDPYISRVTPPSKPYREGQHEPVTARFLPDQRFDLQATVQPDAGTRIERVRFMIDGKELASVSAEGPHPAQTSFVSSGLVEGLRPGSVVVSYRAYSLKKEGIHRLQVEAEQSDGKVTRDEWHVFEIVGLQRLGSRAKNVILFLGDGMGAAHRTAARIVSKGYAQGKSNDRLAMDTFPVTGLVMTASLNSIVTDSSPGMSNYVTGNKANNNEEGVFPDDTKDAFDNPRVEYLSEYLHRTQGTSLGIVTTADVFDATPAANAVHTSDRGKGTGIVDQYLDDQSLTGLRVLMGGGRKWFLPNPSGKIDKTQPVLNGSQRTASSDYVLPNDLVVGWGAAQGAKDPERHLIADFRSAGWTYAPDFTGLKNLIAGKAPPQKLLGLFSFSNMNVAFDKINGRRCASEASASAFANGCTAGVGSGAFGEGAASQAQGGAPAGTVVHDFGFPDQPMLDEMTDAALKVLDHGNDNGFFLMVEGASIDKQSHLMDTDRWILEVLEFDRAVAVGQRYAQSHPDTLVIVTADHECSGASLIGALKANRESVAKNLASDPGKASVLRDKQVGVYEGAGFPQYRILADGYPADTDIQGKVLVGYGANADRYETWLSHSRPTSDSQQPFISVPPLNTYPAHPAARNADTGFFIAGQVPGENAVHTGTDVPLSAMGRGASLFTGFFDNTDVFFKIGQAVLGGVKE